jgi:hypothetical protein
MRKVATTEEELMATRQGALVIEQSALREMLRQGG